MTRNQMILALVRSENIHVRNICIDIVQSNFNDEYIKIHSDMCGSFLKSVLIGDYKGALAKADELNYVALRKDYIIEYLQTHLDKMNNGMFSIKDIELKIKA